MKNDSIQANEHLFLPMGAILVYGRDDGSREQAYVEYFDMDAQGHPVNGRPLTLSQAHALVESLQAGKENRTAFATPRGLLPPTVLYVNPTEGGTVIWYTKEARRYLHFTDGLGIPCGEAPLPPLLWVAGKDGLHIFALKARNRPTADTPLYHAPFFNVYPDGRVCMGNVSVEADRATCLEDYIAHWEKAFFHSRFAHTFAGHYPVQGNIVSLWNGLMGQQGNFPKGVLKPHTLTLKEILP